MPKVTAVAYLYYTDRVECGIEGVMSIAISPNTRIGTLPKLLIANIYGNLDKITIDRNSISKMDDCWRHPYKICNSCYKETIDQIFNKIENELMNSINCKEINNVEKQKIKNREILSRFLPNYIDKYFEAQIEFSIPWKEKRNVILYIPPDYGRKIGKRIALEYLE